ncbi:MAG: nitrogen regulation protein NR(I) [Sphingomonadales bacterium]|nr:nitrogen regulation protein NR(I) [Sphingomonadales bacterium]
MTAAAKIVLLAEDDDSVATVVQSALETAGHGVVLATSRRERDRLLADGRHDLLVTDVVFPDGDGLDTLQTALAAAGGCPVIVLSAQNTLDTAIRASREGAYEYLPKPFDLDELVQAANMAMRSAGQVAAPPVEHDDEPEALLVGRAPAMQRLYRVIARLGGSDLAVLIEGESGTGKELVARAIHQTSGRAGKPFVAVNMAAIPRDLIESELFGHEKGAFTGAERRTQGRFGQAEGGTLFLDEIGDMPLDAQTRLLRVLQSGEYTPVGGAQMIEADVRIVAATNRPLAKMVAEGRFREDLYYRLNVVPVTVPPLRDRRPDIAALCRHFLSRAGKRGLSEKTITTAAVRRIERHAWPGNVRELENFIYRMCVLARGDTIGVTDVRGQLSDARALPEDGDPIVAAIEQWLDRLGDDEGDLYDRLVGVVERPLLERALRLTGGNQLKAAAMLGINRNTLRKRLTRHDLR